MYKKSYSAILFDILSQVLISFSGGFMKKTLAILCLTASFTHLFGSFQVLNPLDQEKAKKELFFTDGVSFDQVEQNLRKKHPHTPEIVLVTKYLGVDEICNTIPAGYYAAMNAPIHTITQDQHNADKFLLKETTLPHAIYANDKFKHLDSHAATWVLTHEIGHAKYPYIILSIIGGVIPISFSAAYLWKKVINSQKPYKNRFTKFSSKLLAAQLISNTYTFVAYNLEERRADNYANKHSNKEEITGGIDYFKATKKELEEYWKTYRLSKFIPFFLGQYIIDPTHPSLDSRIRKLTKAANSKK